MDTKRDYRRVRWLFPKQLQQALDHLTWPLGVLQEIRVLQECPLIFIISGEEYFLSAPPETGVSDRGFRLSKSNNRSYVITKQDLSEFVTQMSHYSLYAYEQELSQGYLTVEGGHRIGVVGQAVLDVGHMKTIRYISAINIRVAHEYLDCARKLLPWVYGQDGYENTLIISPPCKGKTTMLRDLIRLVSDGWHWDAQRRQVEGVNVGVVDERSEIAACYQGIAQNKIGNRTFVLDHCPKADGMMMLVRAMSPKIIAVDEIGTVKDAQAVEYVINSGIHIFTTVHGFDVCDVVQKRGLKELIHEKMFGRFVVLGPQIGEIHKVYDGFGSVICSK